MRVENRMDVKNGMHLKNDTQITSERQIDIACRSEAAPRSEARALPTSHLAKILVREFESVISPAPSATMKPTRKVRR
jgi:hypothetical protein